ncbi:hypothetical protein V6Z12_A12G145700 [Gossypium hirsutum]
MKLSFKTLIGGCFNIGGTMLIRSPINFFFPWVIRLIHEKKWAACRRKAAAARGVVLTCQARLVVPT